VIVQVERERLVISALLLILAGGFTWMGFWAMRGRETYGPFDPEHGASPYELPVRGRAARRTSVWFFVVALIMVVALVVQWR